MNINVVFTLTGPDRIGIVEEVTKVLFELGGNVETSSMARLGGEFAIIMLITMPSEKYAKINSALEYLTSKGYKATTSQTKQVYSEINPGWVSYQIEVQGADHEGIIHKIAQGISQRGINIESMETRTTRAPVSGSLLFTMTAVLAVPPDLTGPDWISELSEVGNKLNVDISVSSAKKL